MAKAVKAVYNEEIETISYERADTVSFKIVRHKFFLNLYHFPETDNENDGTLNDSPWAVIGGVMKYFRMSYEEVVFNRSYINVMLLNRSIPSFNTKDKDDKGDRRNKAERNTKTVNKIENPIHANDFFMGMM